jgi:WD repeat-containing protein 1 (actin-interacting protein 1)
VSVLWLPVGLLVSVSLCGDLNLLPVDSAETRATSILQGHQTALSSLLVDNASNKLYSAAVDGTVCCRDLGSLQVTRLAGTDKKSLCGACHSNKVTGIALVDGETLVSVGWDDKLRVASTLSQAYHSEQALSGQPVAMANSTRSDFLLVVTSEEVSLLRKGSNEVLCCKKTSELGFSPTCAALRDNNEAAIGGSDNKTHVFSLSGGSSFTQVAVLETRSAVSAVAYSPEGSRLAVGDSGRQVELWTRIDSGNDFECTIRGRWAFHTSRVTCLSFSPCGRYLSSGSLDENVYIWDSEHPAKKLQLAFAHTGGVTCVEWNTAETLVSGGNDGTIVFWKVPYANIQ